MSWSFIVIVICVLLATFAVWKEVTRTNKSRLLLRIAATIVAIAALACIAIPITYRADIAKQQKAEVVLLTDGFTADSLRHYNSEKLFTLDNKIKKANPNVIRLNDLSDLKSDSSITQVRVIGNGLDKEELRMLDSLPLVFNPQPVEQGITAINWNEHLKTGDDLNIQGVYKNTSAKKVTLVLKGLSTGLDSTVIDAGKTGAFNLNTGPKNSGRNVFNLLVLAGEDTLEQESIPVQIEPVKPLKVLMLTAAPDFESRFLKNWLSENGYAVAIRSVISKDKFNKEFINMEQFPLDHLSAETLSKFDVLVGDLAILKTLNGAEAAALQQEVNLKGLGVIVRADSTLRSANWLQRDFPSDRLAVKEPAPVSLILQGNTLPTTKLNAGVAYITGHDNIQSLVDDGHGHIFAANALVGVGKIVFTPLSNTFNWILAGNKADYGRLWSLLITKAARKAVVTENWTVKSAIPTLSGPVELQLQDAVKPSAIQIDGSVIAPQQNSQVPFEWLAKYWPKNMGWQSIKQYDGALNWFYVYKDDDWSSIRASKRQSDTKKYMAGYAFNSNVTKQIHEKAVIAVSKIYFYVLLLMACVFLWLEAKLR